MTTSRQKPRRQPDKVEIPRLGFSEREVNLLGSLLTHPDLVTALPDSERNSWGLWNTLELLRTNNLAVYVPVVDGQIAGVVWARYLMPDIVTGMWGFLKPYRYGASEALRLILADVFATMQAKAIMVFVAHDNRQSYAGCWHAGFRPQGTIRGYHTVNGHAKDVWVMIKERDHAIGTI